MADKLLQIAAFNLYYRLNRPYTLQSSMIAMAVIHVICRRVGELETVIERMSEDAKRELSSVTARLHDKAAEASAANEDIERLHVSSTH